MFQETKIGLAILVIGENFRSSVSALSDVMRVSGYDYASDAAHVATLISMTA